MSDPTRWLAAPDGAPEGAVHLLKTATSAPPLPPQVHANALQFAAKLSVAKATAVSGALLAKAGWIVAGGTAATIAAASVPWHGAETHERRVADDTVQEPRRPNSGIGADRPASPEEPEVVYRIEDLERFEHRASPAEAPNLNRMRQSTLEAETELADLARSLLEHDPERALAVTTEYERRFPEGQLRRAVGVIATEALERSGRRTDARQRAKAEIEADPHGIYRDRLRRLHGQ